MLIQLGEHLLYGFACLSDISAPEEMPKPGHMHCDVLQIDIQILQMPSQACSMCRSRIDR